MVASNGFSLVRPQAIGFVTRASGTTIPADWDGAFALCPLPDLLGDGEMWVVDFRFVTNVDRMYLRAEERVRCLSELGWAVFRQRQILAMTRGRVEVQKLLDVGAATWAESDMETEWLRAGRDQPSFQTWLNEPDEQLSDESRRDALERGAIEEVRAALRRELTPSLMEPGN
jgi:hypothetical protein